MRNQYWILCLMLIFNHCVGYAQAALAPTLTAGLDEVVFKRGVLDAQLVLEIISEKQDELKRELVRRQLTNRLNKGSFLVHNFINNSVDILLEIKNPKIITREAMENVANMALVYCYAEYYLQTSKLMGENPVLKSVINQASSPAQISADNKTNWLNHLSGSMAARQPFTEKLLLHTLKGTADSDPKAWLSNLILDLTYDVCLKSEDLKKLGFFQQQLNASDEEYNYRNSYLEYVNRPSSSSYGLKGELMKLRTQMQNQVNLTFRYYHFLRNASKDLLDPGKISLLASATSNSGRGHINLQGPVRAALDFPALSELQHIEQMQKIHSTYAGAISNLANSLLTGLTKITFAANLHPDSIVIRDRMMLKAMYDQIAKLDKNNDMILGMDWVGYLNREVKPALISLNARYPASGIDFATLVPVIESLNRHITELNLVKFTVDCWAARLEVENFKKLVAVVYANWLDIATRLDQLDKAETYKYFLQAIADIGQLYGDVPTQNILNYINNNLVNHFIIDNDHNQVQLDVESLVSEFYNKFGDSNKTRGSLYLSVGANQAVSSNNGFVVKNDERTKIYNVTYVGEKIGFKLKFADRQRKWLESDFSSFSLNYYEENRAKSRLRSREKRYERFYSKPILTNVYALLFGSGLLYQVNFLNSEDAFKKPIVGLALGCSFYNDLDLNLSYTAVTDRRIFNNSGFFNLSFEVKFTEYLTRLSKKRRESKITSN